MNKRLKILLIVLAAIIVLAAGFLLLFPNSLKSSADTLNSSSTSSLSSLPGIPSLPTGTIKGTVTDKDTGKPIAGVTINATGDSQITGHQTLDGYTDANGKYALKGAQSSLTYAMSFAVGGYDTANIEFKTPVFVPFVKPSVTKNVQLLKASGPPLTVTLTADPNAAAQNSQVNLSWTVANSTANTVCTASGAWSGVKTPVASGSEKVTVTQTGNFTYTLSCQNGTSTAVTANANVTVTTVAAKTVMQGKVTVCGKTVPGATLTFKYGSPQIKKSVIIDEASLYSVELPSGAYNVSVVISGKGVKTPTGAVIKINLPTDDVKNLTF